MTLKPSSVKGPLNGITVIDLTHVLSGPYCTMLLAELGARVIKVEEPEKGDVARQVGPFINGKSAYFATINRGKEGMALDLKQANDRSIFERLLEEADVLVENFTTGVMEKLGYAWEELHARYPGLVFASISGFGRNGPLAETKSNDLIAQSMGGVMSVTGPPGGPPTRVGVAMADMGAGIFAATGIISALYHRSQTGEATRVDISMMDGQVALLEHQMARCAVSGEAPKPMGNKHSSLAPFDVYETADGQFAIAAAGDKNFMEFAAAIDRPDLAKDARFSSIPDRVANTQALDAEIEPIIRSRSTSHWLEVLGGGELRIAPVLNVAEVMDHSQTRARNMVVTADDPDMGELKMPGNPIKITQFPDPLTRKPAPDLGRDTEAVKAELAGQTKENIE
ncbi:MAG: CoA transferase [Deltaproteobacteria bacterium]|nr:CoA transferase [Deltaproteobacteria bacterium]